MGRPTGTSKTFDAAIYTVIGLPCVVAGLAGVWLLLIPGVVLMWLAVRAAWS